MEALFAEKKFGVVPTAVLLLRCFCAAHARLEDLVNLVLPSIILIGRTVMPGDFTSIRRNEPFLLPDRSSPGKSPVGILREDRPRFLSVYDVVVPVPHRARHERSEIRARAGLGDALASPVLECDNTRQEVLLLGVVTEGVNDRSHHVYAEGASSAGAGVCSSPQ